MAVKNPLDEDKLAGNASDSRNKFQDAYNDRFNKIRQAEEDADFAQIIADNFGPDAKREKLDAHGDIRKTNWNEDDEPDSAEEIRQKEEAGQGPSSSLYNDSPYQGKDLKSRLLRLRGVKNKGATTGAAASLLFIGGIMISMAGGSSFWTALEKNLTNDGNDDARINAVLHRAFNNMFKVDACAKPGSLKCKFKTMTKEQVKKYKDGLMKVKGTVVDKDGNPVRGSPDEVVDPEKLEDGERVKASSIVFNDTYEAKTVAEFNNHIEKNVSARSLMTRVVDPMRSDFLHGKFSQMLEKRYGINKAKVSDAEKKTNEARTAVADEAKKATETQSPFKGTAIYKAIMSPSSQVLTAGVDLACMMYNATRITVGAVKAKWATDLIRFAWPFVRLISKIQDGSATDADFQEIEERFMQLTDYLSPSKAKELKKKVDAGSLTDDDKKKLEQFGISTDKLETADDRKKVKEQIDEITDKNAFDSQGLQAAIYGDTSGLTDFSKKFSVGAMGSAALTADFIIKQVQGFFGGFGLGTGKQNIRSLCIFNKAVGAVQAAGGLTESGVQIANCISTAGGNVSGAASCAWLAIKTATKMAAYMAAFALLGQLMTGAVAAAIIESAPVLPLDLRGPAAGDALASGIALMLAHKSQSSGLKPALSMNAVSSFITSTQEYYNQYGDELARYDARKSPFDANNRYSFVGQIMGALNPYPLQQNQPVTGFSYISNIFGVVSSLFSNTAQALHSQPSLMTLNEANLQTRLNDGVCESDEEKSQEGMMCDRTSGRTVQVASPRVLQWANEDATGKTDHLADAIDWMQRAHNSPEEQNGGGTKDDTCNEITQALSLDLEHAGDCDDAGEKASIDEQGKAIPGSQFEKFITYCTDKRELEMGSTDIDADVGSPKEQAWHSGKQCAKSYDSNGNASDSDNFDPTKDTGIGSLMMDYFTYYYNMCYVQYAIANNATDCTNDNPPAFAAAAATTPGSGSIAETAKMMGAWGGQYNSCYTYGGGHGRDKAWIQESINNHFAGDYAVDCSAFVRAVILQATGNDIGDQTTQTMCADSANFEHIPRDQAQPGDLAIDCANHVEVITEVDGGKFKTVGSHTTGCGDGYGASPGNYQGTESFVLRYKGGTTSV